MTQDSPFKFLDAYQMEDEDVFFGRDEETEALYDALSGVKHLLVYGPSGSGKTSLVECGLRNQFSESDWFALTIRKGAHIIASVYKSINEILEEKIELDALTNLPVDQSISFGQAIEKLFAEYYQPIYLLFDQFEELLISGTKTEKRDFFIQLNQLIRYKVPCRVMFIMREEFIGHLSEFETFCPSIFKHRFRLEKMGRSNVRAVICKMLEAPRYNSFFTVNNVQELTDSILEKLPDEKREIELTHVQVFLSELWERANEQQSNSALPVLHKKLVQKEDNLESVLDNFLKGQLREMENDFGATTPLELLACMISERHTKLQLGEPELLEDLKSKSVALQYPLVDLLKDLEKRRIVRPLKADDQTQYEISHDLLALVVGQNLTEEMKMRGKAEDIYKVYLERQGYFTQDDLDFIRPYKAYKAYPSALKSRIKASKAFLQEEQDRELKEIQARAEKEAALRQKAENNEQRAQQNAKRARRQSRLAGLVSVIAIILAVAAGWSYSLANDNAEIAAQNAREADDRLEKFLEQKKAKEQLEIKQLLQDAAIYVDAKEYPLAITKLKEVLERDSTNAEARNKLVIYQKRLE